MVSANVPRGSNPASSLSARAVQDSARLRLGDVRPHLQLTTVGPAHRAPNSPPSEQVLALLHERCSEFFSGCEPAIPGTKPRPVHTPNTKSAFLNELYQVFSEAPDRADYDSWLQDWLRYAVDRHALTAKDNLSSLLNALTELSDAGEWGPWPEALESVVGPAGRWRKIDRVAAWFGFSQRDLFGLSARDLRWVWERVLSELNGKTVPASATRFLRKLTRELAEELQKRIEARKKTGHHGRELETSTRDRVMSHALLTGNPPPKQTVDHLQNSLVFTDQGCLSAGGYDDAFQEFPHRGGVSIPVRLWGSKDCSPKGPSGHAPSPGSTRTQGHRRYGEDRSVGELSPSVGPERGRQMVRHLPLGASRRGAGDPVGAAVAAA